MQDLSRYQVSGTDQAFYIPNFVTEEEEIYLIRKITETSQTKWKKLPNRRLQILGGEVSSKNILIPQNLPLFLQSFPNIIERIRSTGAFASSPHGQPNHIILNEYLPGQGIMPHEDGPSYYPVVATLSLNSHAVFHYYQYHPDQQTNTSSPSPSSSEVSPTLGKSIDKTPIFSLLLEPRSLVITTSSLYTTHLHGIDDLEEDVFLSPGDHTGDDLSTQAIRIANVNLLAGQKEREILRDGGVLKREVRYSLTCRDVERVATKLPFLKH
ncbi:hypothetical protein C8Q75DRAFT_759099 [Abortiporus biennis]|nr:hypothetical protein C8Q75DRAFT_759099 [Abortiporus biennis]